MKPRILLVDDDQDTRRMLSTLLRVEGYDMIPAESVREGLLLAEAEPFDLFVLDFIFAEGSGKELCQRIREFDPHTPILFFSGSHPKVQEEALSCGAQGFVLKPDIEALRQEIRKNLRRAA
jgi:DNA-binding response OmpR family regulator